MKENPRHEHFLSQESNKLETQISFIPFLSDKHEYFCKFYDEIYDLFMRIAIESAISQYISIR